MYPRDLPVLTSATPLSLHAPYGREQHAHPGLSLAQLFAILWAWRRLTLTIMALVVVVAAIGVALWPRTWEATATLMVDFEINDPLGGREFPVGLLGSYMSTQVELARGSEVLLKVIDKLKLTEQEDYAAGHSGDPSGLPVWVETKLRKRLLVEQGKYGSQLIYITYGASDAAEAALVSNTVAEVYAEQQHKRLTGPAAERAERYTQQLAELKAKVVQAQQAVTEFRKRSGLIDSDEKGDVSMLMLSQLEARLLEAQNLRRAAESRAVGDSSVGSQVLASPMIQSLKTQLALQNATLAQLRTTLGARHPQVVELQSQMTATRGALNAELGAYAGNAASELASARVLEQKLQAALEERRAGVLKVRELQDSGAKELLELESAQSVYKRALEGLDQVMLAASGGYSNIDFVSRAMAPQRPSKPKVGIIMVLASGLGAALGLALPLFYELLNRRVRCRDDVERDHGIPVLIELGPLVPSVRREALTAA
ncbi:MAG TPA: GNVR domain-containing protein [Verrucomicrobiae bacterium]|nr:GNVR domain-containing protein [Verrucomicrobiae bacterium]